MSSNQSNTGIVHEKFTLVLDRVIDGNGSSYLPLTCKFEYFWDFAKKEGLGHLITINDGKAHQIMLPVGIEGQLDFKTRHQFTVITKKPDVIDVLGVLLDLKGPTMRSAAMIVGNANDNSMLATSDWNEKELKPVLDFDMVESDPIS